MTDEEWHDVANDLEQQLENLAEAEPVFHPTLIAGLVGRVKIAIALIRDHFQGN
jgi:hypothetical protein